MQHRVGAKVLAQVAVEGREGVGRREAALEQQPHRVALVAEGRLHPDEDVAEVGAENQDPAAVALVAARGRPPLRLDLGEVGLAPDVVVGRDAMGNVGRRAVAGGVALQHPGAQGVHGLRDLDRVAVRLQAEEHAVERLPHRQEGGGAGGAGIGREVEHHHRDPALGPRAGAQGDEVRHPLGEASGALGMDGHVAGPSSRRSARAARRRTRGAPRAHHRGGAVEFGDRHHHGRLDRRQPRSDASHCSRLWNSTAWAAR